MPSACLVLRLTCNLSRAHGFPAGAKNIKLKPEVDDSLIGGFVVQFGKDGSGFIDMSVSGQLKKLVSTLKPTVA